MEMTYCVGLIKHSLEIYTRMWRKAFIMRFRLFDVSFHAWTMPFDIFNERFCVVNLRTQCANLQWNLSRFCEKHVGCHLLQGCASKLFFFVYLLLSNLFQKNCKKFKSPIFYVQPQGNLHPTRFLLNSLTDNSIQFEYKVALTEALEIFP